MKSEITTPPSSTNGAPLLPFRRGEKGVSRKPSPLITCQKSCTLHPPTFFSALSIHIPVQEVPAHYVPSSIQSLLFSWFSHPLLITPSSKENLRSLSMILPPNSHTIRNKRMKAFLSASPCIFFENETLFHEGENSWAGREKSSHFSILKEKNTLSSPTLLRLFWNFVYVQISVFPLSPSWVRDSLLGKDEGGGGGIRKPSCVQVSEDRGRPRSFPYRLTKQNLPSIK